MIGALFGFLAACCIGVSDTIARRIGARVGTVTLLLFVFGLSTPVVSAWIALEGRWPAWEAQGYGLALVSGLFNALGLGLVYVALARGPVALASPAFSLATLMLIGLNALAGHPPTALQLVGAGLVTLAVAMLARAEPGGAARADETPAHLRGTLAIATAASAAIAARSFLGQEAADRLDADVVLALSRGAAFGATALFALTFAARGGAREKLELGALAFLAAMAALEATAILAFLVGSGLDRTAAAVGFAALSAVTPVVARFWLGDPLGPRRAVWIAAVVGGVALAGLGGAGG